MLKKKMLIQKKITKEIINIINIPPCTITGSYGSGKTIDMLKKNQNSYGKGMNGNITVEFSIKKSKFITIPLKTKTKKQNENRATIHDT